MAPVSLRARACGLILPMLQLRLCNWKRASGPLVQLGHPTLGCWQNEAGGPGGAAAAAAAAARDAGAAEASKKAKEEPVRNGLLPLLKLAGRVVCVVRR